MPQPSLRSKPAARRPKSMSPMKPRASRRTAPSIPEPAAAPRPPIRTRLYPALVLVSFLLGILSSYAVWGRSPNHQRADQTPAAVSASNESSPEPPVDYGALMQEVNPPEGYPLAVHFGNLGPRLLADGAIDYNAFAAVFTEGGDPLTADQIGILKQGSDEPVLLTTQDAHFLLNFFWAVGLVNKNPILTQGPIVQYSNGQIDRFASTGGWTLGSRPVQELFASEDLIPLTAEQQSNLEKVASAVYRPCCDNPTDFPDCNHGMAMLGLLELLASQNASVDEMFTAAKYIDAYWFPQQALETAIYFKVERGLDFASTDPQLVTSKTFFSGSGAGRLHALLQANGLLPQPSGGGGSCGS